MLTFEDYKPGIQRVTLNVAALYPDEKDRAGFEKRFWEFWNSSSCCRSRIFGPLGNTVTYLTECIIPNKLDTRPPLLLLFGNPASHSVDSGMFFSYEGKGQEHRFWKALRKAGILTLSGIIDKNSSTSEINKLKAELFDLTYHTDFRIGLAAYYSMPSPASKKWSGVAGLQKLFQKEAFDIITDCERHRIGRIIKEFVSSDGAVISFQKDAYSAIKSLKSPDYTLGEARAGALKGHCQCDYNIEIFCLPPTSELRREQSINLLCRVRSQVLNKNKQPL